MRRKIMAIVGASLLMMGAAGCASGGATAATTSSGPTKVKIAAINLLTFSPVFVARELGYFKDEGLDVDIVITESGSASISSLLGGSVDAATTGFDWPLTLSEKGQSSKSLAGLELATVYAFVGGPSFPTISQDNPQAFVDAVKGKKFGVASSGSTGDTIARGVLTEYGLDPEKDVSIIAVGTGAKATAALQTGAVDALVSYEPDVSTMVNSGVGHIVFDLRTTTKESKYSKLPTSTLQATSKWIDVNPNVASALVRAVARADNTLREQPDIALPVLKKLYPTVDEKTVESAYELSHSHFRAEIDKDIYGSALKVYKEAGLVKGDIPYEQVIATQFASDWTR